MKIWDQFKSKSLTKQIFLMVSVVFIVFFLVYNSLMIYTKHNRYIEVPNLSGLNLDDAIDVLKKNRLKYEVLDSSKFFVEIPNYSIISQIPLKKELVKKNRKIYLNVNPRNFQKVSLPNVIQITKRNAESILTALGFQVLEYNYVDDIGKDMVLDVLYEGEIDMLEETYLKIISAKTASLFAAATKVGSILANKESKIKEALEFYGKNLGLTFQIADDALDYNSELKFFGKEIGNDFYEGKVTLPIILLYQKANNDEKVELKKLFEKDERNEEEFKRVLLMIKNYNIISGCYTKAEYFINLASNSLSIFDESKEKEILKSLTSFSLERSY